MVVLQPALIRTKHSLNYEKTCTEWKRFLVELKICYETVSLLKVKLKEQRNHWLEQDSLLRWLVSILFLPKYFFHYFFLLLLYCIIVYYTQLVFFCLFTRKILKVNFVVINGRASCNVWTKAFLIPYCCLMQFIRLLCLTVYKVSSMKVPWYLEFLYRDKVTIHLYSIDLHFYSVWLQDAEVALSPRNKVLI